jgi:heme/copper-type cytochrome/quinol oxidase subunit 2
VTRERTVTEALQWYGLLGSPFAWAGQHIVGFALSEAGCRERSSAGVVTDVDAWILVVTLVAAALVVASGAASVLTYRRTRGAEEHGPPPQARLYFLSIIGIAACPLFLAMVLMSGLGSLAVSGCTSS